jgi:hypothetical protein
MAQLPLHTRFDLPCNAHTVRANFIAYVAELQPNYTPAERPLSGSDALRRLSDRSLAARSCSEPSNHGKIGP